MKSFFLFAACLLATMLTACSAEEEKSISTPPHAQLTESQSINIVVNEANSNTTRSVTGPYSTFASGDSIGLYAVDASGTVKFTNAKFTYDGSAWSSSTSVTFNPDWSYYAYFPYVENHGYSPDFTESDIDSQFATFIADASNMFHQADQSTLANYKASDLMLAAGTLSGTNTVTFAMQHKKALAVLSFPRELTVWDSFTGNIPYADGTKGYFCMKPNTSTTIAGYDMSAASGKSVKCVIPELTIDTSGMYLTFEALGSGTFSVSNAQGTFYYSKNGGDWTSGTSVSVAAGDMVRWRSNATPNSSYGVGKFAATCNFNAGGNPLSLLYGDNFANMTNISEKTYAFNKLFQDNTYLKNAEYMSLPATTLGDHCYCRMFYGCTGLTTAPELPATTLAYRCYYYMFYRCTGLTTAPELPATTLAQNCYLSMFEGCTGLTSAPELPATTLAYQCYYYMFSGCTGLTTAPSVLPATTLAENCYQYMFSGCTGLTTAPELPATTLANSCYGSMFYGCTGLTTAPEILPATTLADYCYQYMFYGCTGLTTAPELPATTLTGECYSQMFQGCSSLNYIKAMFTSTPSWNYTNDWVSGVATSGTFVKNSAATWDVTGVNGVPSGWTVNTASE